MNRILRLNRYQKALLLFLLVIMLIFAVLYPITLSRVGFSYKNAILVPSQDNGETVYSGKLGGQSARFTVSADKTVIFQLGETTYAPYSVKEDPSAIPKDNDMAQSMTGVEIRQGEKLMFRGGIARAGNIDWFYNEDGSSENLFVSFTGGDGIERDANGNVIDPYAPTAATICSLVNDPALTHKGEWYAWFFSAFLCVLNALSILFADELFRWNMSFAIRNAYDAEPSDWQIATRYIGWTVGAIIALVLFIVGLQ